MSALVAARSVTALTAPSNTAPPSITGSAQVGATLTAQNGSWNGDARGNAWKDVYAHNKLTRRIDPLGNTTQYAYDSSFRLTSVTDPRGNTSSVSYDARGNVLTSTVPAPLSYQQSFTYNARNDLTGATDGRGNTTSFGYDAAGNLTSITQPGGITFGFGRDSSGNGLLTSITSARGKTTQLGYDTTGNLTSVVSPLGSGTTVGYDAAGRPTSSVEPRGNVPGANPDDYKITQTYDAAGNVLTTTDALGNRKTWTYDAVGNATSVTDAKNRVTTFAYDNANRLTSVTAPGGAVTTYTYDPIGNLLTRVDPNNRTTTYTYDAANHLVSATNPVGKSWTLTYDANGNVIKRVDANGNATSDPNDGTTTYAYDALNRITSITYSDGTPSVQYVYDANGNRTSMTDGAGTQTYAFDALDRLTQVSRSSDSFAYTYDADGNVTQRTYASGRQATYTYDDDGRMASVASGGSTSTYTYDVAGNTVATALPAANGYIETRLYDRAGRVTEVRNAKAGITLSLAGYVYDQVGNPTTITRTSGVETYSYDNRDRLTEACYQASCTGANDPFIRYAYDAVGNRTSETRPAGTTTYSYDAADQLQSTTGPGGTTSFSFDANGQQTQAGSRTFTYDLAGRLSSTTSGSVTVAYSYDGDGNRLLASAGPAAADKVASLWDVNNSLPQLAVERDGAGALLRDYVHGRQTLAVGAGGSDHYLHRDAIGSVVNVTSAAGATEWTYSYEPFGAARTMTQVDPSAPSNPMRFAGEYLDTGNGLMNLRARQYDTSTGRLLSLDPLGRATSEPAISSYVYADNQPTALIDPSGMGPIWPDSGAGEGCGYFTLSCWKDWFIEDEIGWHSGCQNNIHCLLGAGANTAALLPWGRVVKAAAAARGALRGRVGFRGREIHVGQNWRFAPFGNRKGQKYGWIPHYHRRKVDRTNGETVPGGGIGRHRPWEKKSTDASMKDRF